MSNDIITAEQVEILTKKMKTYFRPGPGGKKYPYVKGTTVIYRLNKAFNFSWSSDFEVLSLTNDYVILKVSLTYKGLTKTSVGGKAVAKLRGTDTPADLGNTFKSALTDGIKKAAEQFGVALEVEDEDSSYTGHSNHAPAHTPSVYKSRQPTPLSQSKPVESPATVTTSAVIHTKKTPEAAPTTAPSKDKLLEAQRMLEQMSKGETLKKDSSAPLPKKSIPFDTSMLDTTISDIQVDALEKLIKKSNKSLKEVVSTAFKEGFITSDKATTTKDITRSDAANLIRHLVEKLGER